MSFNWKDLGNAIVVGEELLQAVLAFEAGQPSSVEISVRGKKYIISIAPKP